MKRLLAVINPISGGKKSAKRNLPDLLLEKFSGKQKLEIAHTYYPGHAVEIARQAVIDGVEQVLVAGGDGTINEVAAVLRGHETALGIIPLGSGNGVARSLGIPMKIRDAINALAESEVKKADMGWLGDRSFLGVAGTGFDAFIADLFKSVKKRGKLKYAWLITKTWWNFKPIHIRIKSREVNEERTCFLAVIANSGQFGNEAWIDAGTNLFDGKFSLVIVRPFPWYVFPVLALRTFTKKIQGSPYVETFRLEDFELESSEKKWHVDGEPIILEGPVKVRIEKACLPILTPR